MKKLILLLVFVIGDCVHVIPNVWWSYKNWTIIEVLNGVYTINDGEWTVHGVPEKFLEKCETED